MTTLKVNFVYIENSFIYKLKDYIKDISLKKIVDYNEIADKSLSKIAMYQNKKLLGSLILKKLNKIISKNLLDIDGNLINDGNIDVYYVLSSFSEDLIKNINKNIRHFYKGVVVYDLYTDKKNIKNNLISNIFKLDNLKNDTSRDTR